MACPRSPSPQEGMLPAPILCFDASLLLKSWICGYPTPDVRTILKSRTRSRCPRTWSAYSSSRRGGEQQPTCPLIPLAFSWNHSYTDAINCCVALSGELGWQGEGQTGQDWEGRLGSFCTHQWDKQAPGWCSATTGVVPGRHPTAMSRCTVFQMPVLYHCQGLGR